MNKRSRKGIVIMAKLIGLISNMLPIMLVAVFTGTCGFLSAIFITVIGCYALLSAVGIYDAVISTLLITLVALALLRGILRYAEQWCNHFIAFKLLALIRSKVFAALRRLAPAKLEGRGKGDLITLITSDVELLEVFYAHTISPILIAIAVSGIMTWFIWRLHPLLAVIAFIAYLIVGVVIPLINSKLTQSSGMAHRNAFGLLTGHVLDSLRGLSEIIRYDYGKKRIFDLNKKTAELQDLQKNLKKYEGLSRGITDTVILLADSAMLFTSIYLYKTGVIEIQAVFLATVAMMSSFGSVAALSSLSNNLALTLSSGDRVLDILEEVPEIADVINGDDISFTGAAAKDVSFSYGDTPILKSFSADIPKGKIVGIVGRSGSGKSTFLKLFMRFWDVKSGKIEISDKNIRNINTKVLRNMQGYVTQETVLFNESIADNIRLANLKATNDEVIKAAKNASLHDFIMTLPDGYNTNAGELGERLSGGERQRVGVARAFLSGAPLILFDEPTSNLDSLNEGVILKALQENRGDKTIILVSHRKSTLSIAEKSYSMNNGRIS